MTLLIGYINDQTLYNTQKKKLQAKHGRFDTLRDSNIAR